MAETLVFELVSPQKLLVSEPVEMVVAPGATGAFGALPHHAPMLSTLRPGVLDVYNKGVVTRRFFVGGGFAEVTETRCTVLAEDALDMDSVTAEMAQDRLRQAEEALQSATDTVEIAEAENRITVARALIEAVAAA